MRMVAAIAIRAYPRASLTISVNATASPPRRLVAANRSLPLAAGESGHREQSSEEADEHRHGIDEHQRLLLAAGGEEAPPRFVWGYTGAGPGLSFPATR